MTSEITIDETLPMADSERIKKMIPHRYPFLLIDKVVNMKVGESAIAIKNVTCNEPHFPGHFPAQAVMPGVLIVEAMAQASAVLVVETMGLEEEGKLVYFMSIESAKFRKTVVPGDRMYIEVEVVRNRGNVWKFKGTAKVDGKVVADATYSAMIVDR